VLSTVIDASWQIGAVRICSRPGFDRLVRVDVPVDKTNMESCGCRIFSRWPIWSRTFVRRRHAFCRTSLGTALMLAARTVEYVFCLGIFFFFPVVRRPIRAVDQRAIAEAESPSAWPGCSMTALAALLNWYRSASDATRRQYTRTVNAEPASRN